MTRTRYRIFDNNRPHFLTSTIVGWLPVFSIPNYVEIIYDSWKFLQRERDVLILGYVILENHLHWIAKAEDLSEKVQRFKSFTARQILDAIQTNGRRDLLQELQYYKLRHKADQDFQLWQEGSHPEEILDDAMMWQKLEYMHSNPLRRGYVDEPTHWRYSSARNYAGQPGLIEILTDWR